jgi:hypothetical protein
MRPVFIEGSQGVCVGKEGLKIDGVPGDHQENIAASTSPSKASFIPYAALETVSKHYVTEDISEASLGWGWGLSTF